MENIFLSCRISTSHEEADIWIECFSEKRIFPNLQVFFVGVDRSKSRGPNQDDREHPTGSRFIIVLELHGVSQCIFLSNIDQKKFQIMRERSEKISNTLFEIFIFCPKIQLWYTEKIVDFFDWKTRENAAVLVFVAIYNYDFTRKFGLNI